MSETAWLMFKRKNQKLFDRYAATDDEDERIKIVNEMNSAWAEWKEEMV